MRPSRVLIFVTLVVCVVLTACGLPGQNNPPPIIIVASPTAPPAATPAPARPTAGAAARPTTAASGPAPTVPAGSPSKGTITFAFDAFPTYYPGIIMEVKGLLKQRGYDLKLVPFGIDGQAAPSEEER